MLPVVTEFVRKYKLDNFIVVADSGLMNNDNIADLGSERLQIYHRSQDQE